MGYYALINNEIVENVIKADVKYIQFISANYDEVIDVTDLSERPSRNSKVVKVGNSYVFPRYNIPEPVVELEIESTVES
jgi:hypothetical protein